MLAKRREAAIQRAERIAQEKAAGSGEIEGGEVDQEEEVAGAERRSTSTAAEGSRVYTTAGEPTDQRVSLPVVSESEARKEAAKEKKESRVAKGANDVVSRGFGTIV